jgi:hypothetical protein
MIDHSAIPIRKLAPPPPEPVAWQALVTPKIGKPYTLSEVNGEPVLSQTWYAARARYQAAVDDEDARLEVTQVQDVG